MFSTPHDRRETFESPQVEEIPALPFDLNSQAASAWLDQLPVTNIRECCRSLFPVVQTLNIFPMAPRVRFEIMEEFRRPVLAMALGIVSQFPVKLFPLDDRSRRVASLAFRFPFEVAQGYLQLVEAPGFARIFGTADRVLVLQRALENLAVTLLRATQISQNPSSSFWKSVALLIQYGEAHGMLDEMVAADSGRSESARGWLERIVLFRLAAPGRLPPGQIARLFDLLAHHPRSGPATGMSKPTTAEGFHLNANDFESVVPAAPGFPTGPRFRTLSAQTALQTLSEALGREVSSRHGPLGRVAFRLGEVLPCPEKSRGLRTPLFADFSAIEAMLRQLEAGRAGSEPGAETGPMELTPQDRFPRSGLPVSAAITAVGKSEQTGMAAESQNRMVEVRPTEIAGYYLIDTEQQVLPAGLPIGLNSDDRCIQIGIVRAGQIHDGRYWHSFELIGTEPRLVRVGGERSDDIPCNGFLLRGAGENTLLMPATRWRSGDRVILETPGQRRSFRLGVLLEKTPSFSHFTLFDYQPATTPG